MAEMPNPLEKVHQTLAVIGIVGEVVEEVWSARAQHGLQHDAPLGFDGPTGSLMKDLDGCGEFYHCSDNARLEQLSKSLCRKDGTWRNILGEEFFEALAADGWEAQRAELVQVAAMAVGAIAAGDAQAKQA